MGARPSTHRKSGGFLNGVDGAITGYRFTDEFQGVPFTPGKNAAGKPKFHSLQFEISVRVDGADEDMTQNLFSGGYDDYEVSDDGLTLTSADGGQCSIGANTPASKFIASLVTAGFPENNLSDDPNSINLEPIVGTRVRFGQLVELDKNGKAKQRVATKGKFAGKSFDQTTTIIEQVYELPTVAGKGKSVAAKTVTKGNGKTSASVDISALAAATLVDIVTAAGGSIKQSRVGMAAFRKLIEDPNKDAVKKLVENVKFYATVDGIEFDAAAQTVSLSE